MSKISDGKQFCCCPPAQQADAFINQANPVSGTLYTVLNTTRNVRITSIAAYITWAVTQPSIDVIVTIDGQTITYAVAAPITGTAYYASHTPYNAANSQSLAVTMITAQGTSPLLIPFALEGRSVKVEIRTTWAVTQPDPILCRVKWAKF